MDTQLFPQQLVLRQQRAIFGGQDYSTDYPWIKEKDPRLILLLMCLIIDGGYNNHHILIKA